MSVNACEQRVSELTKQQQLSNTLFKVSEIIASSSAFEETMRLALGESARGFFSDTAGIALREEGRWQIRYIYNLPKEVMSRLLSDDEFPGAVVTSGRKTAPVVSAAPDKQSGPDRINVLGQTVLSIALTLKSKTTGCIFFGYRDAKAAFEDSELQFAERAARLISLAIDNARLVEERERLTEQVKEERGRFDAVLEEMPAGVIIAEAVSGKLIRGNEQIERILRSPFLKDAEAGVYRTDKWFRLDGPAYQREEWPLARSIASGEMVTGEEIRIVRGDGTKGAISVSSAPIRDITGRIIAGVAVFNDVTDRRLAEEAVRDSESKFRNIASAAQDAVILINNEGGVEFWNDAASKIFGYSSEEMIGRHLHSFIMPERYQEEHVKGFEAFRVTGKGKFIGKIYEIEAKGKDGKEFPVELSLAALKLNDRWNSIGIVRDITARKRVEEELKKTVGELERSNKDLQHFAYAASHDLQEPLRTVASFLQLLSRKYSGKLDEKADRYISFAVDGANRMSTLINDLLTYSRAGTAETKMTPVSMDAVVKQAIDNLKVSIEESGAAVEYANMPVVKGENSLLVQLLQNLLGNAIKFRKKDASPLIRISAESGKGEWLFGVHDNGIGIESGSYGRIFTIFQRLHSREEYAGTGIGLAICRKIVERHGGHIWVESKPGEGSSFYFTLRGGDYGTT